MKGIAVAGSIVHDLNKKIDRFPERNGLVRCLSYESSMGGLVGNCARDLAALDPSLPVTAVGMVGTDAAGDEMLDLFRAYPNIDISHIGRRGMTSFTDVLAEEKDKIRSFVYYPGSNDHMDIDVFPFDIKADIVHVGYVLALDALDAADEGYGTRMARFLAMLKEHGFRTSTDIVSEASDRYLTKVPPILRWLDIAFFNEVECARTVGIDLRRSDSEPDEGAVYRAFDVLEDMGMAGIAVVHMPEGVYAKDMAKGKVCFSPGAIVDSGFIAGTVGAGDAMASGVLLGIYRGRSLAEALEYGTAAATASLRSEKPSDSVPALEDALHLLESLPRRKDR